MPRRKKSAPEEIVCATCGIIFIPKINHPRYKYCSDSCKNRSPDKKQYKKLPRTELPQEKLEVLRAKDRERYRKDKIIYFVHNAKRRALIYKQRTFFDDELTHFVFSEAQKLRLLRNKTTKIEWHVDHVIPLRGKDVCGLHVWNNFAVIPKVNNLRKGIYHSIHDKWSEGL